MTELLRRAIAEIEKLPEARQDAIAVAASTAMMTILDIVKNGISV